MARSPRLLALLIAAAVASGYVAWRWDLGLVWDDTSTACLVGSTPSPATLAQKVREAFSAVQGGGYRPLSNLLGRLGGEAARVPGVRLGGWIIANGLLFGLLAAAHWRLARRCLKSDVAAGYATFLLMASTPILTGGLVIFAGIQAVVPLAFCAAVLCHLALDDLKSWSTGFPTCAKDSRGDRLSSHPSHLDRLENLSCVAPGVIFLRKALAWGTLLTILILGPWYREFLGLISLLLLVREVHAQRRLTSLSVICGLGFAHALFPTAAMRLVFPELPLAPVFRLGSLGQIVKPLPDHISPGTVIRGIQALHWRIFPDLVSILPPTAVALAGIGWWASRRRRLIKTTEEHSATAPDRHLDTFLWIWFLVTFLPFLKVFKIQVHLAYSLVPLSILVARHTQSLWLLADPRVRAAVAALLLVVIADHGLNPVIVHGTTRAISQAIHRQAESLRREIPCGSAVLSNALQIQDVAYASGGHVAIWSLRGGTPDPRDAVPDVPALRKRLEAQSEGTVYALDVRVPELEGQLGLERDHYVVQQNLVAFEWLRQVDAVGYRYPVLDPLKLLTPVLTTPWAGPPDLEFDFYRGPALDGSPLMREVAAEYWRGKIRGTYVRPWQADPALVEEFEGYSLVLLGTQYYAIPTSEGAFLLKKFQQRKYSWQAEAGTVKALKALVSASGRVALTESPKKRARVR